MPVSGTIRLRFKTFRRQTVPYLLERVPVAGRSRLPGGCHSRISLGSSRTRNIQACRGPESRNITIISVYSANLKPIQARSDRKKQSQPI